MSEAERRNARPSRTPSAITPEGLAWAIYGNFLPTHPRVWDRIEG